MKKYSVGVSSNWSKMGKGKYAGLGQQFAIELLIAVVMAGVSIYFYVSPGLGIFFVFFIMPTLIFVVGSMITLYHLIAEMKERKNKEQECK